jgi:hypothetical protein
MRILSDEKAGVGNLEIVGSNHRFFKKSGGAKGASLHCVPLASKE